MTTRLTLALLVALLLSSCGSLQIGDRIRSSGELHVGVAREHATEHFHLRSNMAALRRGVNVPPHIVLAPEVTYRIRRPLFNVYMADKRPPVDITPTGKQRLVYYSGGEPENADALKGLVRVVQNPPKDKGFECYTDAEQLGDLSSPLVTEASLGAQIAAAPFDYVIDPVVTGVNLGVGYTLVGCAAVVATPIWFGYWLFDRNALPPWAVFSN